MVKRTVAVVTGTRAEFGLLAPVIRAILDRPELRLRLAVCGMHLASGTWRDVPAAGFRIDARVPMQRSGATGRAADVAALSRGVAGFGKLFAKWKPDVVLVLGDRIEALAAASAAAVGGFRLAHVHGGDRAEGVADEAMRHAISKLAHVHFPATAQSRRRLIRMGEDAEHVFRAGSPAVDGLRDVVPADDAPQAIVLQHPIGAEDGQERTWMRQTLEATRSFERLVLAPNADPGTKGVRAALRAEKIKAVEHLPRDRFLGLLAGADVIVGNSSAGLIEAAVLRTPCVNVGPRQAGREKPANVLDCDYGTRTVRAAIDAALGRPPSRLRHPYGAGDAGRRIAECLATVPWDASDLRKRNAY